ncbi:hypothetical protein [Aestuariibacter sp. A3R04]|uniref:hypothetical protein n=1 Tax=Aestuariibacter sp. A3R04 TaxID=2841571 RepID=UPI001C097935|nr:hypothetical protein [Aestuariibacter sp. A3R04]MBU3020727.1 hypothetical protein [Aestuariibacter sp. A3R04]
MKFASRQAVMNLLMTLTILGIAPSGYGHAAVVTHALENNGSNRYTATFSLHNNGNENIEAFTLYFEHSMYEDIAILSSPPGWDAFAVDPDTIFGFPEPGFADFHTPSHSLSPGHSLNNIQLSFLWTGNNELSNFTSFFEIYNPTDYSVTESGVSTAQVVTVNAPATLLLLLCGFFLVLAQRGTAGEKI